MRVYFNWKILYRGLLIPVLFSFSSVKAEEPETALAKILGNWNLIIKGSELFNLKPEYLASVIFVERTLNYDWEDEAFDEMFALNGINSSIGFCQIKMKTAYWVEKQLSDSLSRYNPGNEYKDVLLVTESPDLLINKLKKDSVNILYASAYLRIILSLWEKDGFPLNEKPEIIGTLYSTGLFYKGTERKPRSNPVPNDFGKRVKKALTLF